MIITQKFSSKNIWGFINLGFKNFSTNWGFKNFSPPWGEKKHPQLTPCQVAGPCPLDQHPKGLHKGQSKQFSGRKSSHRSRWDEIFWILCLRKNVYLFGHAFFQMFFKKRCFIDSPLEILGGFIVFLVDWYLFAWKNDQTSESSLEEIQQLGFHSKTGSAPVDCNAGKFRKNKGQQEAPRTLGSWHLKRIKNQDLKASYMISDQNILWKKVQFSSIKVCST